jgi:hypothetical protein
MTKEQKDTQTDIVKPDDQDVRTEASEETSAETEATMTEEGTAKVKSPDDGESVEPSEQEDSPEPSEQEEPLASSEQEEVLASEEALERERDESSEYFKEIEKDRRKITALRECLVGAFTNTGEVHDFCQDHLGEEILHQLPDSAEKIVLVRKIIAYCKSRECLDILYKFLARERPKKYISCSERYELFDSINRLELSERKTGPAKPLAEEEQRPKEHPLTQGKEEIRTWFFRDLDQDEQSFVIAVALFEGANRQRIQGFSRQIKDLLFKEAAEESARQTVGGSQSESTDESTAEAYTNEEKPGAEELPDKTIPRSTLKDESNLLQQTNVKVVIDTQYTEHGQTQVQTLAFAEPDQRGKVLRLLNQSLNNWLPELYEYLFELGSSLDAGERRCAALAVAELMCKLSFVDLKNRVLLPWAKQKVHYVDTPASQTLALVALDAHHQREALNLLRHWISVNNFPLNVTALLTYLRIGLSHPDETLAMIRKILDKKRLELQLPPVVISSIVRSIYALYPELVIEYLHEWIVDSDTKQEEFLRHEASRLFLSTVRPSDIPSDDIRNTRSNVVDLIFTLWAGISMQNRSGIQRGTTNLVKRWAEEAIEAQLYEPALFTTYHRLFADLDERYAREKTENRLEFYLSKWGLYDRILAAS